MNFLNLYYFTVAAEELNFTKAAKKLYISQQSLSNHISKLEKEYDVVLFNRTQPASLTEAGHALYDMSRKLLYDKTQLESVMQDIRDFKKAKLTIGVTTSRGGVMMPDILPDYQKRFPQVEINLVEGRTADIKKALYEGKADLYIGFEINDPENVSESLLHTERLVCAVPHTLMEAANEDVQSIPRPGTLQKFEIFKDMPFISMYDDVWLGSTFDKCCEDHDVKPNVVMKTRSMTTLVSLCSVGMGAIVMPEIFVNRRALFWNTRDWKDTVAIYPLDYENGKVNITIAHLKDHYMSIAAQEFIKMAKEIFA